MRGRILAFVAIAFLGSYPIGGPITGLIGDLVGLSWSLAYGAVIVIGATSWLRRRIAADGSMQHAEPVASTLSP
jgi:hypothetical protein